MYIYVEDQRHRLICKAKAKSLDSAKEQFKKDGICYHVSQASEHCATFVVLGFHKQ